MVESGPAFGVFSEHGKLHEVVVGRIEGCGLPPWSPALCHYNADLAAHLKGAGQGAFDVEARMPEAFARAQAQLEALVRTYEARGIKVHRPRAFSDAEKRYLEDLQPGLSRLYPADPVFVLGKHYLELNIRRAYRRKEVLPLRDIVAPMLGADAEARHVAMPPAQPFEPSGEGPGPYLEGGDILVLGRDILVGCSAMTSNRPGIDWLARYIAPHGYQVHPMPMEGDILHALGALCLLRDGLAMAYPPAFVEGLPDPLEGWEILEIDRAEAASFATVGVSLDADHYLIDARNRRVIEELDKRGIEPVPLEADQIGYFGGSLRCATLPVRREV